MLTLLLAGVLLQPDLKTVQGHPMQYYISVPTQRVEGKGQDVVLAIESADREFLPYFNAFVKARGDSRLAVVVPLVITNGGPRFKEEPGYRYSQAVWSQIEENPWKFDEDGLLALIHEVKSKYGNGKLFITGFEAGAHTLFAFAFRHPDLIDAAAPVSPNYAGRNVNWGPATTYPEFRCFFGAQDELWPKFSNQWTRAREEAGFHGFTRISEQSVPGKGHVPMADEVMRWFLTLNSATP